MDLKNIDISKIGGSITKILEEIPDGLKGFAKEKFIENVIRPGLKNLFNQLDTANHHNRIQREKYLEFHDKVIETIIVGVKGSRGDFQAVGDYLINWGGNLISSNNVYYKELNKEALLFKQKIKSMNETGIKNEKERIKITLDEYYSGLDETQVQTLKNIPNLKSDLGIKKLREYFGDKGAMQFMKLLMKQHEINKIINEGNEINIKQSQEIKQKVPQVKNNQNKIYDGGKLDEVVVTEKNEDKTKDYKGKGLDLGKPAVPKELKDSGVKFAKDDSNLEEMKIKNDKKGLDKELALNELNRKKELALYKNVVGAKEIIDKKYNQNKQRLEKENLAVQLGAAKDTLNMLGGMLDQNSAEGKMVAVAQAGINTYEGATKALAQGGFWGIAQMGIVIAAGLAQVNKIVNTEVPKHKGFYNGGRLPMGEYGFIEGLHNEIIAPEKTFIDVFQQELKPKIYGGEFSSSNREMINEIKAMRIEMLELQKRPVVAQAYLSRKTAHEIYQTGDYINRKVSL